MNKKNILNRIKKIISDNNLSNSEFAEKIGIPKSSVTHLLSERNNPSLDVIMSFLFWNPPFLHPSKQLQ